LAKIETKFYFSCISECASVAMGKRHQVA